MLRLQRVLDTSSKSLKNSVDLSKKENENIKKFNEEIDKAVKLQRELTSSTKPGAIARNLETVLKQGLGGAATPEIEKRLRQANQFRKKYLAAQKQHGIAGQGLTKVASRMAGLNPASPTFQSQLRQLMYMSVNLSRKQAHATQLMGSAAKAR